MVNSQLIPAENVAVRGITKHGDVSPNYFTISKPQWDDKPRMDVTLTQDGEAVDLTKIAVTNPDKDTEFIIKYKAELSDPVWKDYKKPEDTKISVSIFLLGTRVISSS